MYLRVVILAILCKNHKNYIVILKNSKFKIMIDKIENVMYAY